MPALESLERRVLLSAAVDWPTVLPHFEPAEATPLLAGAVVAGPAADPSVVERYVFYNNSVFDGHDPQANGQDDNAIATGKTALLPGGVAGFDNYTSFSQGLNGIMVDIENLSPFASILPEDIELLVGNGDDDLGLWTDLGNPSQVTLRRGEGAGSSDRVTMILADGVVRNQWLRVTILANDYTGLLQDDVFYFGNAVAESGNRRSAADGVDADADVDHLDLVGVLDNPALGSSVVGPANDFDFNRDGLVDGLDFSIARDNQARGDAALALFTAPQTSQPPQIVDITVDSDANGHEGPVDLVINLSTALDPATVSAAAFVLRNGVGVEVPLVGLALENNNQRVVLSYGPLLADNYELSIDTSMIQSSGGLGFEVDLHTHVFTIARRASLLAIVDDEVPATGGVQVSVGAEVFFTVTDISFQESSDLWTVELFVDGVLATGSTNSSSPFQFPAQTFINDTAGTRTVSVQARVTDDDGFVTFTGTSSIDVLPNGFARPQILSTTPGDGAVVGEAITVMALAFDQPIEPIFVDETTFRLTGPTGAVVTITDTLFLNGNSTVNLAFGPLADGLYTLGIDGQSIRNANGQTLGGDTLTSTFTVTTGSPALLSLNPGDGSVRGEDFHVIEAFFSDPVDPASVSAGSFELIRDGTPQPTVVVEAMRIDSLLRVVYPFLDPGNYTLRVDPSQLTDLTGTPLVGGVVTHRFEIVTSPTELFPNRVNQAGLSFVQKVVSGDINGDGLADVVAAGFPGVSVLLGNGDTTFRPTLDLDAGSDASTDSVDDVALADMNGDNILDVVTVERGFPDSSLAVRLGVGDGTFRSPIITTGRFPSESMVVADVDEDGDADVVVAGSRFRVDYSRANSLTVFLGRGDGTFDAPAEFLTNTLDDEGPESLVVGMLDGDDHLDAVVASDGGTLSVFVGNGDGTFGTPANITSDVSPGSMALGRLDGDLHLDLVLIDASAPRAVVYLGVGDGTFGAPTDVTIAPDSKQVVLGDVVGDAALDLVVINETEQLTVLEGVGDGSFGPRSDYDTESGNTAVVLANLDNDADLDVVTGGIVTALENQGGTFPLPVRPRVARPRGVAAAQLTEDTVVDVVTANGIGRSLSILPGLGDGTFNTPIEIDTANFPVAVLVGDLDGDLRPDLVARTTTYLGGGVYGSGAELSVFLTGGDSTFGAETPLGQTGLTQDFALDHMDGDGNLDLISVDGSGVLVFPGQGDGSFGTPQGRSVGGGGVVRVVTGRLDADGDLDVVTVSNYRDFGGGGPYGYSTVHRVAVLLGNGDGTLGEPTLIDVSHHVGAVAVGDIDDDGDQDIVASSTMGRYYYNDFGEPGQMTVLLGNGDGTFITVDTFDVGVEPSDLKLVDLDGNGRLDIVTVGEFDHGARVVLIDEVDQTGVQATMLLLELEGRSEALVVADIDADMDFDLVVTNQFDERVSTILNLGNGQFSGAEPLHEPDLDQIMLANFNADSLIDVIAIKKPTGFSPGALSVFLAGADGSYSDPVETELPATHLSVGDVNADGLADVVISSDGPDASMLLLLGSGDGTFGTPGPGTTGLDVSASSAQLGLINNDAHLDLVAIRPAGDNPVTDPLEILVFEGRGDGTFESPVSLDPISDVQRIVLEDVDLDGGVDIIGIGHGDFGNEEVSVLIHEGQFAFGPARTTSLEGEGPMAFGDVDQDGALDLVQWGSFSQGSPVRGTPVAVYAGLGDGAFVLAEVAGLPSRAQAIRLTDVDDDGNLDLLALQFGILNVALGNGDATFRTPQSYRLDHFPGDFAVVDFDGDDDIDLITADLFGIGVTRVPNVSS